MNAKKHILLGIVSAIAAFATTYTVEGQDANTVETFRTTGYFVGLTQGSNSATAIPKYAPASFAGHNLVNLTMGRSSNNTNFPNQVMAMTFACDLSTANLVVYDLAASNIVAIIAASLSVDAIYQQDSRNLAGPNHAYFVATLQVNQIGNLSGGYFTVAGRLNLNPATGCPQPVLVSLDHDTMDAVSDDVELPSSLDPDSVALRSRTGLAHLVGVVHIANGGATETILLPYGGLSVRRELPTPAPVVIPDVVQHN